MMATNTDIRYTAVNLYTHVNRTMAKDIAETKTKDIIKKLSDLISTIDDLLEEPIFVDTIEGEQELALDWTMEMLGKIKSKFEPAPPKTVSYPIPADHSYDAD